MTVIARLQSLQLGRVAPLGPDGVPSGIVKHPVTGPVALRGHQLAGDETADLTVHGGPDKAVYGYSADHYPRWLAERPAHAGRLTPGAFGENLTIAGLVEGDLCIGDIHAIGSARLQVCQPRQPCFKFALRFGDATLPRAMVRNGRCGWYYRVLEPGVLEAGDDVAITARPNPEWPVLRLFRLITGKAVDRADIQALATLEGLASQWQQQAGAL